MQTSCDINARPQVPWSVGGSFLEALAQRDFEAMRDLFATEARFRALLPIGPIERTGPDDIVERFAFWFGQADEFEVVDGSVGEIGGRVHLSWRIRQRPSPRGEDGWHLVEQQAYVVADDRIQALDLLCSGFVSDGSAS